MAQSTKFQNLNLSNAFLFSAAIEEESSAGGKIYDLRIDDENRIFQRQKGRYK